MVFYFYPRGYTPGSDDYLIYMGRDKHENEDLIRYGLSTDVWFHVDDMSSAHVYLRCAQQPCCGGRVRSHETQALKNQPAASTPPAPPVPLRLRRGHRRRQAPHQRGVSGGASLAAAWCPSQSGWHSAAYACSSHRLAAAPCPHLFCARLPPHPFGSCCIRCTPGDGGGGGDTTNGGGDNTAGYPWASHMRTYLRRRWRTARSW